jgi:hypothetical protein
MCRTITKDQIHLPDLQTLFASNQEMDKLLNLESALQPW